MTTFWRATDLSVSPPSYQMADTDRRGLTFDAGEAITGATAELTALATMTVTTGAVESVSISGTTATVTVSNLTRGETYELAVTFLRADGTRWTRTLVVLCVA